MASQREGVYEKIIECSRREFLEKGFLKASLRTISKNAGVTTGTIYSRFKDKEALFDEVVHAHAEKILSVYNRGIDTYYNFSDEDKCSEMNRLTDDCMMEMLDIIYDDYECSKILICCSEGTSYENFIHVMIKKEVDSTEDFAKTLENVKGQKDSCMDKELFHMIASGFLSAFFEITAHDMDKKSAIKRIILLKKFYTGGWERLFGINFV